MATVLTVLACLTTIASSLIGLRIWWKWQVAHAACRSFARDVDRLEVTIECQAEQLHLMGMREQALIRHGNQLIEERNLLRAQLVACTEAPRFPVVTRGSC